MNPAIVAEIGGNHLGELARAMALIKAAADAGASHVKFQCFQPEQMCDPDVVLTEGPWAGRNLLELYRETHTPSTWFGQLFSRARDLGLIPFASVFHPNDVDFLETLDCPMYKVSSFELTDLGLIRHAARTAKPLIISTGMASREEVKSAIVAAMQSRCSDLTLLKCTSAYPSDASDANLLTMSDMVRAGAGMVKVGLSDHTPGIGVAVAAVALGATMIEKHLTLDRNDGGPDAAFSMEPHEFAQLVVECRRAACAIGTVKYGPSESEKAHLSLRRTSGGKRGNVPRGT